MEMTYEEFINNIIETRGRNGCGDEYHETHHIIPKCMSGTNEKDNLIDLFAQEHFIAHKLLAAENPNNDSIQYGWTMMAFVKSENQDRYELTPKEYEEAKIALSKLASKRFKGENNPWYGKHPSEGTREKMKESSRERWSRPEEIEKARKSKSEETRRKLSESAKARFKNSQNHPWLGRHHSEETRNKMSESAKKRCTDEWREKQKENDRCKQIMCVETNKVYISIRECSRETGIDRALLTRAAKSDGRKSAGKDETGNPLHWILINDIDKSEII